MSMKKTTKRGRYDWVWLIITSLVIIFIMSRDPSQESTTNNTKTISLDSERRVEHQRLQRAIRIFPTLSDVVAREISGSTEGATSFQLDQIWKNEFEGKGAWGVGTVVDVREGLIGGHVVRVMCGSEKIELLPRNDQNGQMLLNLNRGQEFRFRGIFYRRGSLVKVVLAEAYLDE